MKAKLSISSVGPADEENIEIDVCTHLSEQVTTHSNRNEPARFTIEQLPPESATSEVNPFLAPAYGDCEFPFALPAYVSVTQPFQKIICCFHQCHSALLLRKRELLKRLQPQDGVCISIITPSIHFVIVCSLVVSAEPQATPSGRPGRSKQAVGIPPAGRGAAPRTVACRQHRSEYRSECIGNHRTPSTGAGLAEAAAAGRARAGARSEEGSAPAGEASNESQRRRCRRWKRARAPQRGQHRAGRGRRWTGDEGRERGDGNRRRRDGGTWTKWSCLAAGLRCASRGTRELPPAGNSLDGRSDGTHRTSRHAITFVPSDGVARVGQCTLRHRGCLACALPQL